MIIDQFRWLSVYKTVSKILTIRLKKVISKVIDVRQSVFLEGMGLLDSILVANEALEELKRKKKSCVFFKVDYEKAYNSVRSPTKEFFPKKGLRQGDLLAPFLFLIATEGLAEVSRTVVEKNLIESLEIGNKSVNFSKSRIGGIGVEQTKILHFATILNCEVMRIPFKYLGMPVGGCHKRSEFWDEVVNRVKKGLDTVYCFKEDCESAEGFFVGLGVRWKEGCMGGMG
ncbi:uncharacterized protein [Phaseolus vulgaris]|uniref:uncharacterized protein n=1 Tax=Phaseolus vulgaris TaxID=3885 RepID=UPI0035CC301C